MTLFKFQLHSVIVIDLCFQIDKMEYHDTSKDIIKELLKLCGKSTLNCDSKVYKEARNSDLGDFALSDSIIKELKLGERDTKSSSLLDDLVSLSKTWPVSLGKWQRGKNGKNIYFTVDRVAYMEKTFEENKRGMALEKCHSLIICDLHTAVEQDPKPFSLTELRCLYHSLLQYNSLRSRGHSVFFSLQPLHRREELKRIPHLLGELDSKVLYQDFVLEDVIESEEMKAKCENHSCKSCTSDEDMLILDIQEFVLENYGETINDKNLHQIRISKNNGTNLLNTVSFYESFAMKHNSGQIYCFCPQSKEHRSKEARLLWKTLTTFPQTEFKLDVVGHVSGDFSAEEAWLDREKIVTNITADRLTSAQHEVPMEKVRTITLASLKSDLLKKSLRASLRFKQESDQLCDEKAGSFLVYNCARIGSILKLFEEMKNENVYPDFPNEVNLSLLTESVEWSLVFRYISSYHQLMHEMKMAENHHKMMQMLVAFSHDFSSYYNRTHILTDPREHLYPKMFARLYLLKECRQFLQVCLDMLGIKLLSEI